MGRSIKLAWAWVRGVGAGQTYPGPAARAPSGARHLTTASAADEPFAWVAGEERLVLVPRWTP